MVTLTLTSPTTAPPPSATGPEPQAAPLPDAARPPLRVVVADDHPLYREGIVRALDAAGMLVVAEGGDGQAALELIREHRPDVALLDVSMPLMDGIDVIGAVARARIAVPVVLLSAFGDQPLVLAGLQAGAATYITKTADRDEIVRAVADAADPAKAPGALIGCGDLMPAPRQQWIPHLTLQEHQALQLAQAGLDKAGMAQRMGTDEPGVRRCLAGAIDKIGVETLSEALQIAVQAGVVR